MWCDDHDVVLGGCARGCCWCGSKVVVDLRGKRSRVWSGAVMFSRCVMKLLYLD